MATSTNRCTDKWTSQICAQVASEGSVDEVGLHRTVGNGGVGSLVSGTIYAMVGVKLKNAYRNIRIEKRDLHMLVTTADNYIWRLVMNPTVGGTFTYADVTNSALQVATASDNSAAVTDDSWDIVVAQGFGTGNNSQQFDIVSALRIGSTLAGVRDALVLTIEPLSNNLTAHAALGLQEYI